MVLLNLLDPGPCSADQIALAVIVLILAGLYDDKRLLVIVRIDKPGDIEVQAGLRHLAGSAFPASGAACRAALSGGIDCLGRQLPEDAGRNYGLRGFLVEVLLNPGRAR